MQDRLADEAGISSNKQGIRSDFYTLGTHWVSMATYVIPNVIF
jgi:hypothetical protein